MTPRDRDGSFTHTHDVMHLFPTGFKKVNCGMAWFLKKPCFLLPMYRARSQGSNPWQTNMKPRCAPSRCDEGLIRSYRSVSSVGPRWACRTRGRGQRGTLHPADQWGVGESRENPALCVRTTPDS